MGQAEESAFHLGFTDAVTKGEKWVPANYGESQIKAYNAGSDAGFAYLQNLQTNADSAFQEAWQKYSQAS